MAPKPLMDKRDGRLPTESPIGFKPLPSGAPVILSTTWDGVYTWELLLVLMMEVVVKGFSSSATVASYYPVWQ